MARRTTAQQPKLLQRGRAIGGSSAINGQIAIRGIPADFDSWVELGCTGWSWSEVLPYFRKLENDLEFGDAAYHGNTGPIPIYRAPLKKWGAVDRALKNAASDLGYGWCPDHNAPTGTGVSPYAINSFNERRVSTNDAYIEPARGRGNLDVIGDALVDHLNVVGNPPRVLGVTVKMRDGEKIFNAKREVILSAGAIHSPAILQRSGVGPRTLMKRLGLNIVKELPVGKNLLDHPMLGMILDLRSEARVPTDAYRHTNCCLRYSSGLGDGGENDMMMIADNLRPPTDGGITRGRISVAVYQPFSEGHVEITTTNPLADPSVEECMLSDERDLIRMRDGVSRLVELGNHPAVREIAIRAEYGGTKRSINEPLIEADLHEWMLSQCTDDQHVSGTCRMGSPSDRRSVVDPFCRLIGCIGVRIVDASIMPRVVRANTHLTTVMIAEKVADIIKQSHRM